MMKFIANTVNNIVWHVCSVHFFLMNLSGGDNHKHVYRT
jgi:hypothetical protein